MPVLTRRLVEAMDKADLIVVQRERLLGGRQTTREVWLSSLIEWVI